jgi:hypothetical protein
LAEEIAVPLDIKQIFQPIDRSNEPTWPWFARSNCPACGAEPGKLHEDAWCPVIRKPDGEAVSYSGRTGR